MSSLVLNPAPTMSSMDLLDMVNEARAQFSEPAVRRNDFTARCLDELEGEYYETFVVRNPNGTESEAVKMSGDQCMYVLMRESKAVRRVVTAKLKEKSAPVIPQSLPEALRLAADLAERNEALALERDEAVRTKAQIGSRREASAMASASAAKREAERLRHELGRNQHHATVIAVEQVTGMKLPRNAYVPLRAWCKAKGVSPVEVVDERYGMVKAWPAGAWLEVFDIDLRLLFGAPSTPASTRIVRRAR